MSKIILPQKKHEEFNKIFLDITGGEMVSDCVGLTSYLAPGFFYRRNYLEPSKEVDVRAAAGQVIENSKKGYPPILTVTPDVLPDHAEEILQELGFSCFLPQYGMIFDLEKTPLDETVNEYIQQIEAEEIDDWQDAMLAGFKEEGKQREDVVYHNLVKCPEVCFFAYKLDGKIASTGLMVLTESDYVGIYEIATPAEYRGKGYATALVRRILQISKQNGKKGAVLQASNMGKPVYQKIGFEQVCLMNNWIFE